MGLITAIRQFFWTGSGTAEPGPRVAEVVRQEQVLLKQALMGAAYELRDDDLGTCRVVTDRFTVIFQWYWRERWITASILLHRPPDVPLYLDFAIDHDVRSLLEAVGIPAPQPRAGFRSAGLVRDEIQLVRQVVAEILSDERKMKDALFHLIGKSQGYNDRAVVPEDLPPDPVILWTEERLRQSGRPSKDSRAGEPL